MLQRVNLKRLQAQRRENLRRWLGGALADEDTGVLGNLDLEAIDDATWSSVQAVMTTNLYGVPDRMDQLASRCEQHGVLLLEDAAHALDSRFGGRRVGTFGDACIFSFGKHLGIPGGALTFRDPARRPALPVIPDRAVPRRASPGHRCPAVMGRQGGIVLNGRSGTYLIDMLPEDILNVAGLPDDFDGSVLDFMLERGDDLRISRAAISATNATADVAKALEIQRGDVLLKFVSQLYSTDGRVLDYTFSYFIPGYFNFHVVRRIGNA